MNLLFIDREFKKLNLIEDYINYKFEPRSKVYKGYKRNIYYEDLKNDFVDEVNAYGFSPFIQETYDTQRKDKNIMQYKSNYLNQGLLNYVKKRNKANQKSLNIVNYKLVKEVEKKGIYSKSSNHRNIHKITQTINDENVVENNPNKTQKDFLQKALENLNRNKLNLSNDSDIFSHEKDKEKEQKFMEDEKNKKNKKINKEEEMKKIKSSYLKSLTFKVKINPLISDSIKTNNIQPNNANLDKFFNNVRMSIKSPDYNNEVKKVAELFNNKDINANIKNNKNRMRASVNFQTPVIFNEINRQNADFRNSIKISNERRKTQSVFKNLYALGKHNQFGPNKSRASSQLRKLIIPEKNNLFVINTIEDNGSINDSKVSKKKVDNDFTYSNDEVSVKNSISKEPPLGFFGNLLSLKRNSVLK